MGGLIRFMPFTYTVMLIGTIALLGLPWLSGFYSKDLILELAYGNYQFSSIFAFILGTITAFLTAFYSMRLINLVFLTVPNGSRTSYLNSHEVNLAVIIPLFVLGLFSIVFGYFASDFFVGIGSDFFGNSVFIHPNNINLIEAEFSLDPIIKLLPTVLSITGALLAVFLYHFSPNFVIDLTETSLGRKMYTFLNGKYLFDVIYNKYIIGLGFELGYTISKVLDRGVIELVGPYGISTILTKTGVNIGKLDTGVVTTYSLYITLGLLSLLFLVFAPLLVDTSLISEIRLVIIYLASLLVVLWPNENSTIS